MSILMVLLQAKGEGSFLDLGAWATLGAGVLSAWVIVLMRRQAERRLLRSEFRETYRHYVTNRYALARIKDAIQLARKRGESDPVVSERLSVLHFEKLKAPPDSIFFNAESFRVLGRHDMERALLLKIRLRNRNLEAQRVVSYLEDGKYDLDTLEQYVVLLDDEHERVIKWMRDELKKFISDLTLPTDRSRTVLTEPEPEPRYPKIEALDIERLADMVAERLK